MAYVGLAKPIVAKLNESSGTPKYTEGAACGKAIGIDITPQYAEGSLYGDDVQCEYDKEFKYADITLNTTTIPISMQTVMSVSYTHLLSLHKTPKINKKLANCQKGGRLDVKT